MLNRDEKWVYETLMKVSSPYLDTNNVFNYFLPYYFNLNNNSIVFNVSMFSSVDTLDLTNTLNVQEVQVNIQGKNPDEIDDITSKVIDIFHGADDHYIKNVEIGVDTSFYNELLSVHQTTIIIYIRTNPDTKGSFSNAFSASFDIIQN